MTRPTISKTRRTISKAIPSKAISGTGVSPEDDLLQLLWEIPRMWRTAMDRRLKPLGLSQAKWRTILWLSRGSGDVSQVELAQLLGIEAPTLARLLDRMAADGWIERRAANNDRRIKTIHLLAKASSLIKTIDAVLFEMRKEALRNISKAEIRACANTLEKIRTGVELDAAARLRSTTMRTQRNK